MPATLDGKSFEELMDLKSKTKMALSRKLDDALCNLAREYVDVHGAKEGMEEMCDDFFRNAASRHYPDGWSGLLQYAIKMAG